MMQNTRNQNAFTLIELMVVILVLGLLMGILIPTIPMILRNVYTTRTASRIQSLDLAVWEYKQNEDLGGNFPGVEEVDEWEGVYTGSQVVAAHLFDYYDPSSATPYSRIDSPNPGARSTYADYKSGMLGNLGSGAGQMNFMMDAFPDPKPIAYYPSGRGNAMQQFRFADNSLFTGKTVQIFEQFIEDPDVTGNFDMPVNRDGFLFIAPGGDRTYFTEDDVRNW
jgi:prepilin-type N-terminal cleavage/methylation domain-containing protein